MSEWEQRLRNLAEGPEWQMPNLSAIGPALSSLTTLMNRVASETGFTGQTERDAVDQMQKAKADIEELRRYVQQDLPNSIADANRRREEAQRHLDALDSGSLSADAQQTIRNAAAGATIFFPGFSVIAGEGAIAAANWFLGSQREAQAKSAVEAVSNGLDQDAGAFPTLPEMENVYGSIPNIPDELRDTNIDTGGPSTPSVQKYPDYNVPTGVPPGQGGVIMPDPDGGGPRFVPNDPDGGDNGGPGGTGRPPIYNGLPLPGPGVIVHPDGPTDGIGTYPGGGQSPWAPVGAGGSGGSGGVGSGGSGSGGLSSGFMAGAGGAAALGGLGKAAAAGGLGRLGGLGGVGGGGGAGIAGRGGAGGLGGVGGGGGAGIAGRGGAGGLGGGLTANAGGGAGGGLLGKGGVGGGGAAGAAAEAGGSRGATGMMGGGGAGAGAGGGGRSDKKGRGLGGPIAPSIEDDAEFGPRSEGAGAGGRD